MLGFHVYFRLVFNYFIKVLSNSRKKHPPIESHILLEYETYFQIKSSVDKTHNQYIEELGHLFNG